MNLKKRICIYSSVIILTFVFLIVFKSVPVSRLWNSYSVCYVSNSLEEKFVLDRMNDFGIDNVISLNNQIIPFTNEFLPYIPESENSYISKRINLFRDKNNQYRLFYVEQGQERKVQKFVNDIIQNYNIDAGMDGLKQYPWITVLISFLFFIFLLVISENKKLFLVSGIFPVLLVMSLPFYPILCSCILIDLFFYFLQKLWFRRGLTKNLFRNYCLLVPIGIAFIVLVFLSLKSFLLGFFVLVSSFSALFMYTELRVLYSSKIIFSYKQILPANYVSLVSYKNIKYIFIVLALMIFSLIMFVFSSKFSTNRFDSMISYPVPVEKSSDEELPNLEQFYKWSWNVTSFPYRSLNSFYNEFEVQDGDSVVIPSFSEKDNLINENNIEVLIYNEKFRDMIDDSIDLLPSNCVEKLLKKQGTKVEIEYNENSKLNVSSFSDVKSLILILLCVLVPIFLTVYYYLFGIKKYENSK